MTSPEGKSHQERGAGAFWLAIRPERSAPSKLLRIPPDPAEEILLRGEIQVLFNGSSPVGPRDDRRVTEDGWIPIHLFDILWDLVATCKRVLSSNDSQEAVSLHPSDFALVFERHGELVAVRLLRIPVQTPPLAEALVPLRALVRPCLVTGTTLFTWIVVNNPELRGNLRIQRLQAILTELDKSPENQPL
jgi:hypothetical protein